MGWTDLGRDRPVYLSAKLGLLPRSLSSTRRWPALATGEVEVLALLAEGVSNNNVAGRLGIYVHTAKFHVSSILDKLDATGRTDAVAHAARTGVIQL